MTKKTIQLLSVYILLLTTFSAIYYAIKSENEKQLGIVTLQIDGLEYLNKIASLNTVITDYVSSTSHKTDAKKLRTIFKEVNFNIDAIYEHQKENKEFSNKKLNRQLELIKKFEFSQEEYYEFLETINHENYRVGDKAKLMLFQDRELYFFGSLTTHYTPEFIISGILTHYLIQELRYKGSISDEKKKLLLERIKLTYLSGEEIHTIVRLLEPSSTTEQLTKQIDEIHNILYNGEPLLSSMYKWDITDDMLEKYLLTSSKLIALSTELQLQQYKSFKSLLQLKVKTLKNKILETSLIFYILLIVLSFLTYVFYRSTKLHEQKDKEIERINKDLDELVIYSKTDVMGKITYVSSAMEEMSGYTKEELLGKDHNIFRHEKMPKEFFKNLWETILEKNIFEGEVLNRGKDGKEYWVRITITPDLDANGNIISFHSHRVNITDQKALQENRQELLIAYEKLEKLSVMDTLTKIYNRAKLDTIMSERFESFNRYGHSFSLILIDIDHFKSVNDNYGHLVGDETLKSVTKIVSAEIRETDIFGRWGGEEFMVVCEETGIDDAYKVAQKIRIAVEQHSFETIGHKTISIGISEIKKNMSIHDFIKNADDALYYAKENGRNRCVKSEGK